MYVLSWLSCFCFKKHRNQNVYFVLLFLVLLIWSRERKSEFRTTITRKSLSIISHLFFCINISCIFLLKVVNLLGCGCRRDNMRESERGRMRLRGVVVRRSLCSWEACEEEWKGSVCMPDVGDWGGQGEGLGRDWPLHQRLRPRPEVARNIIGFSVREWIHPEALLCSVL